MLLAIKFESLSMFAAARSPRSPVVAKSAKAVLASSSPPSTSTSTSTASASAAPIVPDAAVSSPGIADGALATDFEDVGLRLYRVNPSAFLRSISQLIERAEVESAVATAAAATAPDARDTDAGAAPPPNKAARMTSDPSTAPNAASASAAMAAMAAGKMYQLPEGAAEQEYYQCMECGERRRENSFRNDHSHAGTAHLTVKWFCSLCGKYLSVTYRSSHLLNKHNITPQRRGRSVPSPSPPQSPQQPPHPISEPQKQPPHTHHQLQQQQGKEYESEAPQTLKASPEFECCIAETELCFAVMSPIPSPLPELSDHLFSTAFPSSWELQI